MEVFFAMVLWVSTELTIYVCNPRSHFIHSFIHPRNICESPIKWLILLQALGIWHWRSRIMSFCSLLTAKFFLLKRSGMVPKSPLSVSKTIIILFRTEASKWNKILRVNHYKHHEKTSNRYFTPIKVLWVEAGGIWFCWTASSFA